jgi:HEAT repeat protein
MAQRLKIGRGEAIAAVVPRLVRSGARPGKAELVPTDEVERVLQEILALGDARTVPCLIGLLGAAEQRIRHAAARTLDGLVPRGLTDLVFLESKIRDRGIYGYDTWWPEDRPHLNHRLTESQARLAIADGLPIRVLGVLSFNADGRVRELATRALSGLAGGEEVPFLLLRANDWVSQVMQPARNALLRRCTEHYAAAFAGALPLVERIAAKHRVDHGWLVRAVHALLIDTESGLESVTRLLAGAGDRDTRRAAARLVRVSNDLAPLHFQQYLTDSDPIVRALLVTATLERATAEQLQEWVPMFLADSSARIRTLTFTAAEAKGPDLLASRLQALLFDENVWLREFARQKLGRSGPHDFRQLYINAVVGGNPTTLRAALAGLGEIGGEPDAAFAVPHVAAGPARVRRVALQTVHKLQKERAAPTILAALGGESAGVSKVATELVLGRSSGILTDDLAALTTSSFAHVRANALRALAGTDRWEALIAGLERISDSEPRVARAADRILAVWRQIPASLYTHPSASQRARIRVALLTNGASLPDVSSTINAVLGNT